MDPRAAVASLLRDRGLASPPVDWEGCDAVWPALEAMADEGAVVVVKLDGERTGRSGRYSVVVSGGRLGEDYFRQDTAVLEDGLARAILHYAERCWV
jgi:hypothetical protein